MQFISDVRSGLRKHQTEIATAAAVLSLVGAAVGYGPRFGPGRACGLYLRSRLPIDQLTEKSVRKDDVSFIRNKLSLSHWGQRYLVVVGEKGVGKSLMLKTATAGYGGVVKITVRPGDSMDTIVSRALDAVINRDPSLAHPATAAHRVSWFYRKFCRESPVVVISVAEVQPNQTVASLTGAVRELADMYHLRVIVDASPNSLAESILHTTRETVLKVERLTKEQLFSIPEFQDLFMALEEFNLKEIAWKVLGGNPQNFQNLARAFRGGKPNTKRQCIEEFLENLIREAINLVRTAENDSDMVKLIQMVKDADNALGMHSIPNNLNRTSPDKVLSTVYRAGIEYLVPASHALDIVIRFSLKTCPTLKHREEVLGSEILVDSGKQSS